MSNVKFFIGLLAGAAVGATVGLLTAPQKGATVRKKLTKEGKKYSKEINKNIDEAIDGVYKKFNEISSETDKVVSKLKNNAKELESKIK